MRSAGWDIVSRGEYISKTTSAVKEALMQGNTESDYLLFIDDKTIAVVEAKKKIILFGPEVVKQAESYAVHPQSWYGLWVDGLIPLVYMANGNKIYFKNMLLPDSDYIELPAMHTRRRCCRSSAKRRNTVHFLFWRRKVCVTASMMQRLPLRTHSKAAKKNLAVLATGSGKTYLACLASYRLLNYTSVKRVLFLVDRNNLARQTESEFSLFDKTENQQPLSSLYQIKRLKRKTTSRAMLSFPPFKTFCSAHWTITC